MKSALPLDKIQLIERSLRCFYLGLPGVVPVFGLPFAVAALGEYLRVTRRKNNSWNPARNYLHSGTVAAALGLLLSLLFFVGVIVSLITR